LAERPEMKKINELALELYDALKEKTQELENKDALGTEQTDLLVARRQEIDLFKQSAAAGASGSGKRKRVMVDFEKNALRILAQIREIK
jgi:hypothetical protein